MSATKNVRLAIDMENNAEEFWAHLNGHDVIRMAPIGDEARKAIAWLCESAFGHESIVVPVGVAEELVAWLETLPGWESDCEYAPNPILVNQVEEE